MFLARCRARHDGDTESMGKGDTLWYKARNVNDITAIS